ncbi:MAG: hypothetical protein ACXQT1_04145 [Methermicoccaceae archaeon]
MDARGERDILIERLENIIKQKDEEIASLRDEVARLKEGEEASFSVPLQPYGQHDEEMSQLKTRLEKLESTSKEMAASINTVVDDIIDLKSLVKDWEKHINPPEPEPKSEQEGEEKAGDILLY